jgi:putative SOS response-associated peptidase YedK
MCNRYRMTAKQSELASKFGFNITPEPGRLPPPELFPKRPAYVVREQEGARVLDVMTWGFPPPMTGRAPVTNVRNLASPFWRGALNNPDRRCLVPVT